MNWLIRHKTADSVAGIAPRSQSANEISASNNTDLKVATRPASVTVVEITRNAKAAHEPFVSDFDDEPDSQPEIINYDSASSRCSSVRTPADLSHEASRITAPESAAGSQHHLPNLMLSDEELISEELSQMSQLSSTSQGKERELSRHPGCQGSGSGNTGLQVSMLQTAHSNSSSTATGAPCSPIVKAMFSDAQLPCTPKACSHSNLRILAVTRHTGDSHNSSCSWALDHADIDDSSSLAVRADSIGLVSTSRPTSGATGRTGSLRSTTSGLHPVQSVSSDEVRAFTCSSCGSSSNGGCGSSNGGCGSSMAGGLLDAEEDEDLLICDMDACLGSLQAAVNLAKVQTPSGRKMSNIFRSSSGSGSRSNSGTADLASALTAVSNSGSASSSSNSGGGGTSSSFDGFHRSRSRLAGSFTDTSKQLACGNSGMLTDTTTSASRSTADHARNSSDGLVLLKIGSKGRPITLREPVQKGISFGSGGIKAVVAATEAVSADDCNRGQQQQQQRVPSAVRCSQEDLEDQCLAAAAAVAMPPSAAASAGRLPATASADRRTSSSSTADTAAATACATAGPQAMQHQQPPRRTSSTASLRVQQQQEKQQQILSLYGTTDSSNTEACRSPKAGSVRRSQSPTWRCSVSPMCSRSLSPTCESLQSPTAARELQDRQSLSWHQNNTKSAAKPLGKQQLQLVTAADQTAPPAGSGSTKSSAELQSSSSGGGNFIGGRSRAASGLDTIASQPNCSQVQSALSPKPPVASRHSTSFDGRHASTGQK